MDFCYRERAPVSASAYGQSRRKRSRHDRAQRAMVAGVVAVMGLVIVLLMLATQWSVLGRP
jgi:hypothetical protein